VAEYGFGSEMPSGWTALGRPDVAEASERTPRAVDILGEPFDSLDTCHHMVRVKFWPLQ